MVLQHDQFNSTKRQVQRTRQKTVETLLCEYLSLRLIQKNDVKSQVCIEKSIELDNWFINGKSPTDEINWICFRTMLVHQLQEIYGENITEQDIKDFIHQIIFVDETLYTDCKDEYLEYKIQKKADLEAKIKLLLKEGKNPLVTSTIIKSYCHPNNKSIVDEARVMEAHTAFYERGGKLLRKSKKHKKLRRRKSIRRRR